MDFSYFMTLSALSAEGRLNNLPKIDLRIYNLNKSINYRKRSHTGSIFRLKSFSINRTSSIFSLKRVLPIEEISTLGIGTDLKFVFMVKL